MAKNTIAGIIANFRRKITANKRKGRVYYERFYQIDEVIGLDKSF